VIGAGAGRGGHRHASGGGGGRGGHGGNGGRSGHGRQDARQEPRSAPPARSHNGAATPAHGKSGSHGTPARHTGNGVAARTTAAPAPAPQGQGPRPEGRRGDHKPMPRLTQPKR
jgi:ATP-dependent RNA helicase RhlE